MQIFLPSREHSLLMYVRHEMSKGFVAFDKLVLFERRRVKLDLCLYVCSFVMCMLLKNVKNCLDLESKRQIKTVILSSHTHTTRNSNTTRTITSILSTKRPNDVYIPHTLNPMVSQIHSHAYFSGSLARKYMCVVQ